MRTKATGLLLLLCGIAFAEQPRKKVHVETASAELMRPIRSLPEPAACREDQMCREICNSEAARCADRTGLDLGCFSDGLPCDRGSF